MRFRVLDVDVDAVDIPSAVQRITAAVSARAPIHVVVANVHSVMEARQGAAFRDAVAASGLTVPDGMPLVWMGRLQRAQVSRVYGPDLTLALCEAAARLSLRCFFYGGAPGVGAALAEALSQRFPGLVVAGTGAPPFRPLSAEEEAAEIAAINASRADVVFVGLGCPKQEIWMHRHRPVLDAPVLVGVGAAFDFLTGRKRQAPRWMMRVGLEWLFRLATEPSRLIGRYLVNNPLFMLLAAWQLLSARKRPR